MSKCTADHPKYVIQCSHLGEYGVVLCSDGKGTSYSAMISRGGQYLVASAAHSESRAEMEQHFEELDKLMRGGAIEELMKFRAEMIVEATG